MVKISLTPFAVALIAGAVLILGGCSSPEISDDNPGNTTSGSPSETVPGNDVPPPSNAPSCDHAQLMFGETCEDVDGIRTTVQSPVEFTPSPEIQDLFGDGHAVRMTIEVYNNSDKVWLSDTFALLCTPGTGATIVDEVNGVSWHEGNLEPGQQMSFDVGCWVTDPTAIKVTAGSRTFIDEPVWTK
ncbi:MAG: hypothetical protein FWD55_08325 [Propionibacteriaceae bacterium]|nr:hypothetical protein [Propionibacteriaceae bacterium]